MLEWTWDNLFSPSAPQSSSPTVKSKASLGSRRGQDEIGEQVSIVSESKQPRSQAWSLEKGSVAWAWLFKGTMGRLLSPLYASAAVCGKQASVDLLWKWDHI